MSTLKSGELFAGVGGLGAAVDAVFESTPGWFAEYEKAPSKVLARRHSEVPNYGDVTLVDWGEVETPLVASAGYPCQPFSLAGRRGGTEDERHLWPTVVDMVAELRPPWLVFENVRGHLSLGFDEVLRDLTWLDYSVEWIVVRASDAGAPHQRARLFILGWDNKRA